MVTFGDLRSAVNAAIEDASHIDQVIWVLMFAPLEEQEHWVLYAHDTLQGYAVGRVVLTELMLFCLEGEFGFLELTGNVPITRARAFLCGWAWAVVSNPTCSPYALLDVQGLCGIRTWDIGHHRGWMMRDTGTNKELSRLIVEYNDEQNHSIAWPGLDEDLLAMVSDDVLSEDPEEGVEEPEASPPEGHLTSRSHLQSLREMVMSRVRRHLGFSEW